jgi:EAL domain-containing protein (putative c-di-GMP-specific phosphodiesterase class I)
MTARYLPEIGEQGKVVGFHLVLADARDPGEVPILDEPARHSGDNVIAADVAAAEPDAQEMFVDTFSDQVTGRDDSASRIVEAIERDEFHLFSQRIVPLSADSGLPQHYEILIRLMEEEEGMMPPGAFFPLAEKYGLMPRLDRWVVQHVAELASFRKPWTKGSMLFINVAVETIADADFPAFVSSQLQRTGVPGDILCFEVANTAVLETHAKAQEFARQLKQCGCRIALSGFGRDRISFELLRDFQVDYLKIDGNVILGILRDPVDFARVAAISRVAKTIGVRTIAEFVESDEISAKLRKMGLDFAQGFGISQPCPLADIL